MAIMAIVMLLSIHLLSNAAIDSEIKKELRKRMELNLQNISFSEDGKAEFSENFQYRSDGVDYVVIRKNGQVISGEYPKEIMDKILDYRVRNNLSFSFSCNGETYYVRDIRVGKMGSRGAFIRGIIRKSDADSFYRSIEMISYISMAAILCVILFCEMLLSRKISRELGNMCKIAERIGSDLDMSQRMREDNRFYELAVLAQANNRMLDQMEKTLGLQEQFASDVAHELRTPVSVMLAQCHYSMEKEEGKDAASREALEVFYRQSKKMDSLIMQLLDLSRLDQNRMQLQDEMLDLVEIAQSVCEEWQEKAENGIRIRTSLKEAIATGDMNLIFIVISNLVSNAVKFSHPDGTVDVSTGLRDGFAYVQVEDYGIGIEEQDLNHVFDRFYRCDKSRNAEGFGLGLSLSEKIAEKHGGKITVSSVSGRGSVFTLYLPAESGTVSKI